MRNRTHKIKLHVNRDGYRYSGGNKGVGNVDNFVGKGRSGILVSLVAEPKFHIRDVNFEGGGTDDFTF